MRIGIAISVYDKFDELELLIDMIKSWKGEYEIGVCCNHKDGLPAHLKEKVDYYIQGRDIPFVEGVSDEKTFFFDQDDNYSIRVRAADCVRMSCWLMTRYSDCEWVIHVHADAWFMHERGLRNFLIGDCMKRDCFVACRGTGIDSAMNPFCSTSAYGQSDDHFFAFHREFADHVGLWDYLPEDLLMRKYSVHGLLMTIFAVKVGLSNVWYYKQLKDLNNYAGEPLIDEETKPCVYDKEYGFLHLHRGSLPDNLGKALQAYHILVYGESIPKSWANFIIENQDPEVVQKIRVQNDELNKKLRLLFYPKKIRDKTRITYKELLIRTATWKTPFKNIKKRIETYGYKKLFPSVDVQEQYKKLNKMEDSWDKVW